MRRLVLAAALAFAPACSLAPRFDGATQAALARGDMRKMETKTLRLYYPAARKAEALRVASHVEACVGELRKHAPLHGSGPERLITLIMPDAALNNAYVIPPASGEPVSIVPTFDSTDVFTLFGLPPDPSAIACHEVVHYVHSLQISGFPALVDTVFGDAYTPQVGLDSWFWEGLAVFYETRLQPGIGRLASDYWDGVFESGMATQTIDGGDLHDANRRSSYGMHYLVGSHFIDWLVATHGEEKLWSVIRSQSNAVLFPLGVSVRFHSVYGKTLSTLIDEFAASVKAHPRRVRPDAQRPVRALGTDARIARGRDGTEAIIDAAYDVPSRISVFGPDGKLRLQRNLADVLPPRTIIGGSPNAVSGLSVSADGSEIYFVLLDAGDVESRSRLLRLRVATNHLEVVVDDLRGAGGSLTPDGRTYVFSRARGDGWLLARLDLASGTITTLDPHLDRRYVLDPQVSPDGKRVLATTWNGSGPHRLEILDLATSAFVRVITGPDGAHLEGRWIDDDRLAFVGSSQGRFQVFVADLRNGSYRRVTDAPHLAWAPRPQGSKLRFLSRDGWTWSEDEVDLPAEPAPAPSSFAANDYPAPPGELSDKGNSQAASHAYAPVDEPVTVFSDDSYSHFDGLFRPQVRGPVFQTNGDAASYGIEATGADRLSFHRWLLAGAYDPKHKLASGAVGWLESSAAPWYFMFSAATIGSGGSVTDGEGTVSTTITRETTAYVEVLRDFFGHSISARLEAFDWRRRFEDSRFEPLDFRFVGPTLEARYAAVESTPYSGARRALVLLGSASYYPRGANSGNFSLADFRGGSTVVLPVPPSKRMTFHLSGFVRRIEGAPLGMLQVGGQGATFARAGKLFGEGADPRDLLPPALTFTEDVRGFEDLGFFTRGAAGGQAFFRYPFIVDWGTASTLLVLPSLFVQQLELEIFGSATTLLDGRRSLLAAGASLALRLMFYRLPITIRGQIARRLSYDERYSGTGLVGVDL